MSFANWKKRTKLLNGICYGVPVAGLEKVAQAAYKAGERDGRKQVEVMARAAIALRDKLKK